jgi:hypothetical protein
MNNGLFTPDVLPDYNVEYTIHGEENLISNGVMAGGISHRHKQKRIEELAYYKWLEAGQPHGRDVEFWNEAQAEYEAAERFIMGL